MTAILNPDRASLQDSDGPRCFHLCDRLGLARIRGDRLFGFVIAIDGSAHGIDTALCAEIAGWAHNYAGWEARFAITRRYLPEDCRDFPVEDHAVQGMALATRMCDQLPDGHNVFYTPLRRKASLAAQWLDDVGAGGRSDLPITFWGDGTPIARDNPDGGQPWGTVPEGRWVRVMPDSIASGLWDVTGCERDPAELQMPDALRHRLATWQDRYDRYEDDVFLAEPPKEDEATLPWLSTEGLVIAQAIKATLPADWIVVYHDIGSERLFKHLYEYAVEAHSMPPHG